MAAMIRNGTKKYNNTTLRQLRDYEKAKKN